MAQPTNNQEVVLIDVQIGEGEDALKLYADLNFVSEDIGDYSAKLREARGLPISEDAPIMPDNELITVIENQLDLPENTPRQVEAKNTRIENELRAYYQKHLRQVEIDATMLALTMDNKFVEEPKPYDTPVVRSRPGLLNIPEPTKNLQHPVERRLKQLLDYISKDVDTFKEFMRSVTQMSIDARRRLVPRDKDGFHGGTANANVPPRAVPLSVVKSEEDASPSL